MTKVYQFINVLHVNSSMWELLRW